MKWTWKGGHFNHDSLTFFSEQDGELAHLVHVENEVELADIFEALVERLYEDLDEIEDAELGLGGVDAEDKVEGRVVTVDQLVIAASQHA